MKFGVTYQTSKRVGSLYMPAGPDRYEIVEIDASIGKAPDELIKKEIGVKVERNPESIYIYAIEMVQL
ncbi:hypothetical protein NLX67_17250 [Domibacillus sp. A3M-37]|uniref:hypothetical protein n=1 Tax=Domibacillus sp. A3M-37 TaxID=2962037 RepID=UPI0020B881A0|nr:hypothetical protein [Domibacillus sp. A3M-37]MCP3764100.1 hypothetical protein [Domibacillus sp. A3M-37]